MKSNCHEISHNVYWVGSGLKQGGLHCNPYLIIDGEEAVLIDPGSVLDFEEVFENVISLISLQKIKYVVLHHQDPDFCSSVPLFEKKGGKFKVVTHWRTQELLKYYGIESEYYIVNEHEHRLILNSGRILAFIPTPYLHFSGAIATYDYTSKILFSSDLFGAFSHEWTLYADGNYIEKMKAFHEHYMPSNDILRPVMESLLSFDIYVIAPQHGSIINSNIREHIKILRELECGAFLNPIRKNLFETGGYTNLCNSVIKRYAAIFSSKEILDVLADIDLSINADNLEIQDYNYRGAELWVLIFDTVYAKKGIGWLSAVEPMVSKLCRQYDLKLPPIFESTLYRALEEVSILNKENKRLKEINDRLNKNVREAEAKLLRCPITGLYNYDFFMTYISNNIKDLVIDKSTHNPALLIASLDNISKIRYKYGDNIVNESLNTFVYLINDIIGGDAGIFRLHEASFAVYFSDISFDSAIDYAEKIRNIVFTSDKFIEKTSVSIGLASFGELKEFSSSDVELSNLFYNTAMARVKIAKSGGMNIVCAKSETSRKFEETGKILIVDSDELNIDILTVFLTNLDFKVIVAKDGDYAIELCERELPDLIIAELMVPKYDGFAIRERLLTLSHTKNIPYFLMSHLKNDDSVRRANVLGIEHYFKKPYMISELIGVVKNKTKVMFMNE